jgi:hypothetical protein
LVEKEYEAEPQKNWLGIPMMTWPEITDKMAANSISYAHNELILPNHDGGYYTVFYYRQYKIDAHNEI